MKWNKTILSFVGKRIIAILCNDTIYSVLGVFFGVICSLINYFVSKDVPRATFWMLVALVCIMNLKETPK